MFRLASHDVADRRILIVEDDADTVEALRQTIMGAGGTVVADAATVEAGLDLAKALQVDQVMVHIRYTTQTPLLIPDAFAGLGVPTVFIACHDDWFDFDDGDDGLPRALGLRSSSAARG